jgi:hypothetical protein
VRQGRVLVITNESPAYHPSFAQMQAALEHLDAAGIDLTGDGGGVLVIVYDKINKQGRGEQGKRYRVKKTVAGIELVPWIAEFSDGERLSSLDISDLAGIEPGELLADPSPILRHPPLEAAARSLRYARAAVGATYDEMGFRLRASTPAQFAGVTPLETFASVRLRHDRELRRLAASEVERVRSEQGMLRHRAIDFTASGSARNAIEGDLINITVTTDDGAEESWVYALSHLPEGLRAGGRDWDAPTLASRQLRVDLPGMRWLPVSLLVREGRFRRMQEWGEQLETTMDPGRYYAFISHRWLTPAHPDPEGRQAQFAAWQLLACLCEGIRVAQLRGLHQPRQQSAFGPAFGAHGSGLAESMIVNVLRVVLDSDSLDRAAAEATSIRELTRDHGVMAAAADPGLGNLRAVLAQHPALAALLARISVWYDYSCLPQPPRTDDEDTLFRQGLAALNPCQILGITLVLLDDAEDYLTRAWCTLEALTADSAGSIETLVGSQRPTAAGGTVEDWFGKLLQDRPHIVWRGLLDTEVFGVQDAHACLERLSLAATDQSDLPFIYDKLRSMSAPRKVHVDQSEIITGTLPLPALRDGRVLAAGAGWRIGGSRIRAVGSLDWTEALALGDAEPGPRRLIASWVPRAPRDRRHGKLFRRDRASGQTEAAQAHLCVVAACEGEATLIADWVQTRVPELETMLGLEVVSMSWTASDIAAVGHLAEGALRLVAVEAPVWVLATVRTRFEHDLVTSAIAAAVAAAGWQLVRVVLDEIEDNIEVIPPPAGDPEARSAGEELTAVDPGAFGTRIGGLHRLALDDILRGRRDPDGPE